MWQPHTVLLWQSYSVFVWQPCSVPVWQSHSVPVWQSHSVPVWQPHSAPVWQSHRAVRAAGGRRAPGGRTNSDPLVFIPTHPTTPTPKIAIPCWEGPGKAPTQSPVEPPWSPWDSRRDPISQKVRFPNRVAIDWAGTRGFWPFGPMGPTSPIPPSEYPHCGEGP